MVADPSTMDSAAKRPAMPWATRSSAVEVKRQTALLYALSDGWTAFYESDFSKSEGLFSVVLRQDRMNPEASAGLAATYRARHLLSKSERVVTEASRSGRRHDRGRRRHPAGGGPDPGPLAGAGGPRHRANRRCSTSQARK